MAGIYLFTCSTVYYKLYGEMHHHTAQHLYLAVIFIGAIGGTI